MVLAELGQQISSAVQKLSKKSMVDDDDVKDMLNEIAKALLQADVDFTVVRKLQQQVKAEVQLTDSAAGLNKRKVVQQAVFNSVKRMIDPGVKPFTPRKGSSSVIMFVGLQGSGKTTSITKYALHYANKGLKTGLICADTFRAGAYDQLKQNATKAKVHFYGNISESDPVVIAREGVAELKKLKFDVILVDTSGRNRQEAALFEEMSQVEKAITPSDIVYVMDATNGQGIKAQAEEFKKKVKVGSVIITKMDCQAKGGGAVSAVAATGSPIIFIGTGEHFEDFEAFNPHSFVSKMLGMGDISGLVETLKESNIDANSELYKRFQEGTFTMRDMYEHLENMNKLGSVGKLMEMIPGMQNLPGQVGTDGAAALGGFIHMMDSMTVRELDDPDIRKTLTPSRIARIARGSGHSINEVNNLLITYAKFEDMAKKMGMMNFKAMSKDPGAMMGRGGMNSQQMKQLTSAIDPRVMKQLGGAQGFSGLMKQMSKAMGGGAGGFGM